jgi:hypothetical protein
MSVQSMVAHGASLQSGRALRLCRPTANTLSWRSTPRAPCPPIQNSGMVGPEAHPTAAARDSHPTQRVHLARARGAQALHGRASQGGRDHPEGKRDVTGSTVITSSDNGILVNARFRCYFRQQLRRALRRVNEFISITEIPRRWNSLSCQNLHHRRPEIPDTYHWYSLIL